MHNVEVELMFSFSLLTHPPRPRLVSPPWSESVVHCLMRYGKFSHIVELLKLGAGCFVQIFSEAKLGFLLFTFCADHCVYLKNGVFIRITCGLKLEFVVSNTTFMFS